MTNTPTTVYLMQETRLYTGDGGSVSVHRTREGAIAAGCRAIEEYRNDSRVAAEGARAPSAPTASSSLGPAVVKRITPLMGCT
jgi:hypothetical protein